MGRDCCGQQASAPEILNAPDAGPAEQSNVCQQSRSDDDCSETLSSMSLGGGDCPQAVLDDCCSSGKCEDEKAQDGTDQPDCCSSGECDDKKAQDNCCSSGKCEDDKAQDDCCSSGNFDDEKAQDDCCSSGECENDKVQDDTDQPDCCRGKVSPCCDSSCLDRLAMRECEMNAAILGSGAQTNGE